MEIKRLSPNYEEQYMKYILSKENTLFYLSIKYKNLLEKLLGDESYYLIAIEHENIVGALPLFIHRDKNLGTILNSLPYYGSNGAAVADREDIMSALLKVYSETLKKDCVAGTIVTSPFEDNHECYRKNLNPDCVDERIGQITFLPVYSEDKESVLWNMIHKKTQGAIKKALKSDIEVRIENTKEAIDFLYALHKEGMNRIGGLAKKREFFELFPQIFTANKDYKIYVAYQGMKRIAAVLIFYFNQAMEYFVPVTKEGFRIYQPLSLIIYEAMRQGMSEGYKKWNWGGTWLTQEGVHRFKERWGTTDLKYYYYTNIVDKHILTLDKDEILERFPNYYVYPFNGGI